MFVQLPDNVAHRIRDHCISNKGHERMSSYEIHHSIFVAAEHEWREYICYLEGELATLVC